VCRYRSTRSFEATAEDSRPTVDVADARPDRGAELVEGGRDSSTFVASFDAEFVVSASKVLDERMCGR
jgi:hypothetical protein